MNNFLLHDFLERDGVAPFRESLVRPWLAAETVKMNFKILTSLRVSESGFKAPPGAEFSASHRARGEFRILE